MLINANALSIPLADKSVHLVVTSPPYYGLRDYGTAKWEGGDPECEHSICEWNDNLKPYVNRPERDGVKRQICIKCGATRIDNQIGLEQTPEEYVNNLVAVFKEVRRVLVDDGIVYLNLGDSYTSMKSRYSQKAQSLNGGKPQDNEFRGNKTDLYHHPELGLKDKDLIGIPWMVAFALRADGWYLRDDIIWAKGYSGSMRGGAVMPESTKDRCTKAYEHIFMLTKKPKYYYDYYATLEPVADDSIKRSQYSWKCERPSTKNGVIDVDKMGERFVNPQGANPRNVWLINTKPFKGAHYATFPPELVRLPILAGTSEKGHCPKCGARWERVMESTRFRRCELPKDDPRHRPNDYNGAYGEINGRADAGYTDTTSIGWQSTCDCGLEPVPDIVLDPFCGSGTTLMVAKEMGRQAIGLDLSFQYLDTIAKPRLGILLGG